MSEDHVTVDSRIHALPDAQAEVEQALLKLVQRTQAEEGCISFDLHQSLDDPCQFRISECWASHQSLSQHMEQPYLKAWLEISKSLVAEPIRITLWKMIGSSTQR